MTDTHRRLFRWLFYGGLTLLLLLIVTTLLAQILPSGLAARLAYNSEGYLFAVALAAWLQYGMPRLSDQARMRWALAVGVLWLLIGVGLALSDLPSRIRTLNESALALAFLIPYVTLPRPLPRWTLLSVPVMIIMVVWGVTQDPQGWIVDQAETFGFLILAVLTLDLIDRSVLEPGRLTRSWALWAWYGFMVIEPVFVSALGTEIRGDNGALAQTLQWLGRIHESFIGVLLVVLVLRLAPVRPRVPTADEQSVAEASLQ